MSHDVLMKYIIIVKYFSNSISDMIRPLESRWCIVEILAAVWIEFIFWWWWQFNKWHFSSINFQILKAFAYYFWPWYTNMYIVYLAQQKKLTWNHTTDTITSRHLWYRQLNFNVVSLFFRNSWLLLLCHMPLYYYKNGRIK